MEDKMSLTSVDAPSQLSIASINNYGKTNTKDTVVSPLMSTSSSTGTTDYANNAEEQSTIDNFEEQHKKKQQIARVPTNKKTEGGDSCSCQTYSELHKTFMAELQFMLQEFKKLEQQLLWNGGVTNKKKQLSEQDTVAQNNRRHKLQTFLQQLMDIIRELEVNQNILSDSPSTNGNYLNAVHKLECHIRTSILPVKARLLKQLSAQQQQQQQQQNHHHLRSTATVYGQQSKFNSAPVAFANQNNLKTMNRLLRGAAPSKLTQNLYGASPSIMNNEKGTITTDETRIDAGTSADTATNLSSASDVMITKQSTQDVVIPLHSITKTTIHNKSPSLTLPTQVQAVASTDIMDDTNTYKANNNQVNAVPLPSLTDPVTTKEWGKHDKSQNPTSINSVIPTSNVQTASLPPSCDTAIENHSNHMLTDTTTILAAPTPVPAPAANDNLTEKNNLIHTLGLEQQHVSKLPTFENGKPLQTCNTGTTSSSTILQLKNKKKKRKKTRKHAIQDVVALLNHPKRHHHHIISYIDESSKNLQTALSSSSKNPMSSGAAAAIKVHRSSHHVVMDRCIELTCASCNEIYAVSINSGGGKNNNTAATTSNKYYNPWWSLRREACPKCNQIQIPRIDISAPANYLEYHPALLAHINIDQGNRTSTRSMSPPCLPPYTTSITGTTNNDFSSSHLFGPSMQNSNFQPASRSPSGKLDNIHPMEESSTGSCDEECSENDSDELDSSSICEALHMYENEDYGKNYSGPRLQDTDAARLLILFNHARNCPGRHLNTKHNQVCQSVKYIMLHVRDCSGSMNVPNINETNETTQKSHDQNNLENEHEKMAQEKTTQGDTGRSATMEKNLIANSATAGVDLPPQGNSMTTVSDEAIDLQDKTVAGNSAIIQNVEEERDFSKDSSFSPTATCPSLISVPCPFPWCRPVKSLLYHLLRCTAGKQCRICHPRCISDNLATLSSLNAQWKNKANASPKATEGTANDANLDASAKVEMMLCVESMLAAAGNDSISEIDTKRCTVHPGDPSILNNEEFMMKTSESFLLPHTFPSLPDDMMSSGALLAEVGKEGNSSIDNVADGLSLNVDRWEENQFSRGEVHSGDSTVRQQTPWSSCTDEMIGNLGESNNISLVIPVDANDSAG